MSVMRPRHRFIVSPSAVLWGLVCVSIVVLEGRQESYAVDLFIETTRAEFEKIPVSVFPFHVNLPSDSLGFSPSEVLKADLERSQLFRVVELNNPGDAVYVSGPEPAAIERISETGVSASIWGRLNAENQEFHLDVFLYEGEAGRRVAGKRYIGSSTSIRAMVHRLANMIIYRYSGERGIAETKIAYVSELGGSKELFVMDYDGDQPRRITVDRTLNLFPQWSPDLKTLAYTSYRDGNPDIHLVDLTRGTIGKAVAFQGANITPAWSPDGNELAFAGSFNGNSEIYAIRPFDGVRLRRLTFHPASDFAPSWSPLGFEIAFSSDRDGSPQIYLMDADGSNVRRLTYNGRYNTAPAWSPEGHRIAYTCRMPSGSLKICITTTDGRQWRQVSQGEGDHESPSWSPDGRYVAFSSTFEGRSDIYIASVDGKRQEQLTTGGLRHTSPAWSPWK